ncbi:RNA polymerase sigma factor RpoS [Streptomyces hirsutus]
MSASTAPPQDQVSALTPAPAQSPDAPATPAGPPSTAPPPAPLSPAKRRGADTRALTQVLFGQLKNLQPGTPEHTRVRAALIEANLPLVRYAAARFRSRNEPMEDVVQVGTIGLINAIDRFDPERGVQFPTFAMPTVVGEIKRYFRDNVRTVHVPRRLHELLVQVNSATEDLTTAFGRSPMAMAEIAERLRISEEEVLSCIEAGRSYHATSLEAAQEGDGLPGLLDRLGYEDPALDGVEHLGPRPAPARPTPRAGTADPAAAVLQQPHPVADQRRTGRLPDARLPARRAASSDCGPQTGSTRNS